MKVTIQDIAHEAGVSIATVSHVINATRYVSPELTERVKKAIKNNNYNHNIDGIVNPGKRSQIAFLVPRIEDYAVLADILSAKFSGAGYAVSVLLTNDDIKIEKNLLTALLNNKSTGGIILVPAASSSQNYEMLLNRSVPFVLVDRFFDDARIDSIITDYEAVFYRSVNYLIQCGHNAIGIITEKRDLSTSRDQISGYRKALAVNDLPFHPELVLYIDSCQQDSVRQLLDTFLGQERPTALVSGMGRIIPEIHRVFDERGLECPGDISFIGVCHNEWTELLNPSLTIIRENCEALGAAITAKFFEKNTDNHIPVINRRIQADFLLGNSTRMIGRGPFGEKAATIEKLTLSEDEKKELRRGQFKVAISFHYGNTAWMRLHENGIRDTLEKYGVKILSVTEAHFNPALQVTQLEGLRMQKPDAIIAIPSDDMVTSAKFKELAKQTKLIFISNIPIDMQSNEYASCVSVNDREGGYEAGVLFGEYFKNREEVRIGFIAHGVPFYGTRLRDGTAEQVIHENYPFIDIVSKKYFRTIEHSYEVCREMIMEHPEIEGLYVSWDGPALQVIKALKELKREDVVIFTFDLDQEIASHLARGDMVKGLVIQRPYVQGTAVALATAKALLGKDEYKYVVVSPYVVRKNNLVKAWEDIFRAPIPEEIKMVLKS